MNGKDIFLGLKYVGADLIEQAEYGTFSESRRRRPVRPLLIAALVALLLMLVGCAVAYMLNMQSMKIGKLTESQPILSEDAMEITGYRDVPMQVLTLAGFQGSPNYQAAQEWYQFKQSYDPNLEIYQQQYLTETASDYQRDFGGLPIYTQEMQEAMDAILKKYNLLPPGELLQFRTLKRLCTALGIEKIQTAQNDVGIQITHGSCNCNGNFLLSMQFALPIDGNGEIYDTWGTLFWCRKDCFTPEYATIADTNDWKEWNYTTAAGSQVLIFRSPSDWRGWIVCQREEAQMVLQLEARTDRMSDKHTEYQFLTDGQMEMIADAIDFSIQPNKVTQEEILNQEPIFSGLTQNGWTVAVKNVKTDGYIVRVLLGITAPETVDITHVEADDIWSPYFDIHPGNRLEFFEPEVGQTNGYSWNWLPEDDGDGLDFTQNYVMTCNIVMMDETAPFADGTVWNLLIEDIMHYRWDSKRDDVVQDVLAEGEWQFTLRFGNENGDYRKMELLQEPLTLPAIVAWDGAGNAIWETAEVTSIEVHPMSVHFLSERANVDYGVASVVMHDGTRIPLSNMTYNRRCIYESAEWIDLTEADYLLMQDGTKIPIPNTADSQP